MDLNVVDWLVIAAYFAVTIGIALWALRQERQGPESSADYFLAGRNVGWFVVGASLFASNIGSEHLVGLAGDGARVGLVVGQFEVLASLILILLGWVFVPFYIKSGVYTMPEFLERRYSPAARWYLAGLSILAYVLTKISVTIFAGAIVFQTIGVPFWTGALVVVVVTGLYTLLGGLRAVVYTDLMQAFVLIGGAVLLTGVGLARVGGWGALTEAAGPAFFSLWRPATDPDFPWTGIVLGAPILGIWYWCTDQFIVQRTLSARGVDDARRGALWGGYLKLLPLFIFVVPGIVALVLFERGELALVSPDTGAALAYDPEAAAPVDYRGALPALIGTLLPTGLRGLLVAGLLAALMSSLSSVFNSCSTLITWDVYRKLRPHASERQLVWVGRLATGVLVVLGLLWIPLMKQVSSGGLYQYLQSVQAYISPPIAAVFLLGVFWRRLNAQGAVAALFTGAVLGLLRLTLATTGTSLGLFTAMNFLIFAFVLFVVCALVLVAVSLATAPPPPAKTHGLTYGRPATATPADATPLLADATSDPRWRRRDRVLTVGLALAVAALWLIFS